LSFPINCSPITNAYAIPFGVCWIAYDNFNFKSFPSPSVFSSIGVVSGVDIINISLIPDFANVYNG
jgi:hypothetical protein